METIRKLTSGVGDVYEAVMGNGLKTPSDQVIKEYPGLYIHSILISRI